MREPLTSFERRGLGVRDSFWRMGNGGEEVRGIGGRLDDGDPEIERVVATAIGVNGAEQC
jgi:hypothetical protein